ncbi:hypothetical protein G6F56_007357 [Rhizopus delemar]|nr:hypothetical protein G6F56_007357 [Rhizopus delemar]
MSTIRSSVAQQLGLNPDASQVTTFTNADSRSVVPRGAVLFNLLLSDVHFVIKCHVVDNLSNQVILGYWDLKVLEAVIDTSSNEMRILKPSGLFSFTGLSSGSTSGLQPAVYSMMSFLRLPGRHHAYVGIETPPTQVYISRLLLIWFVKNFSLSLLVL